MTSPSLVKGCPPTHGMCDTGASASAGPEESVTRLVQAVAAVEPSIEIVINDREQCRHWFRFGSGSWGQAVCKVELRNAKLGRELSMLMLPSSGRTDGPVPVLVGMSHLRNNHTIFDTKTGTTCYAGIPYAPVASCMTGPREETQELQHCIWDLIEYQCEAFELHVTHADAEAIEYSPSKEQVKIHPHDNHDFAGSRTAASDICRST